MTGLLTRLLALLGTLLLPLPALAHQPTFSTLNVALGPEGTEVTARLSVLALLHELDETGGSPLPMGTTAADLAADPLDPEVAAALAALLEDRLALGSGGDAVALDVEEVTGAADEVTLAATAPGVVGDLTGTADLFPSDPMHKAFLTVRRGDDLAGQWALDAASPAFALEGPERPVAEVVSEFVYEGVRHIFIGPDHILFVLALILLGGSLWTQVKIITAFTLAHSITLTLATLGLVTLPSRLVESVIALSVVVVGLHDLWRVAGPAPGAGSAAAVAATMPRRDPRPTFAFAFGLIHGFGFASVLGELDLPREALAWALGAFNLGVELGQVAIVLATAPALWALRRFAPPLLVRGTLVALAGAVVLVGGMWFWERAVLGA